MSHPKTNWTRFFVYSGGMYFVPQNMLPLGRPSTIQHHLHTFILDYMYVQDSLRMYSLYDLVSLWINWGSRFSLNYILLFYQATFKIVTKELPSLVIIDFHWPWIGSCVHKLVRGRIMDRFCLSCVRLVYFLRKSTEFHVSQTDFQRILFHFLLLIFS